MTNSIFFNGSISPIFTLTANLSSTSFVAATKVEDLIICSISEGEIILSDTKYGHKSLIGIMFDSFS